MTILHIVLFEPKQGAGQAAIDEVRLRGPLAQPHTFHVYKVLEGMRALQTKCVNPSTQKPYIKSLTGGKNNSIEAFKVYPSPSFPLSGCVVPMPETTLGYLNESFAG